MSEIKIARFVDIAACKSIFSDCSTFVLRSSEYYKRLYETSDDLANPRGDRYEMEVQCADGSTASAGGFVISCWTVLDGSEPMSTEWSIFPDTVVAIVSTPNRVCAFLREALEVPLKGEPTRSDGQDRGTFPFFYVDHRRVTYTLPEGVTDKSILDIPPFAKAKRFAHQKEYRFVLPQRGSNNHLIDSYIFSRDPDEYMDTCLARPGMCKAKRSELQVILSTATAGYGHFGGRPMYKMIANSDVLFDDANATTH